MEDDPFALLFEVLVRLTRNRHRPIHLQTQILDFKSFLSIENRSFARGGLVMVVVILYFHHVRSHTNIRKIHPSPNKFFLLVFFT